MEDELEEREQRTFGTQKQASDKRGAPNFGANSQNINKNTHYKNQKSYDNYNSGHNQSEEVLITEENEMVLNDVLWEKDSNQCDQNQKSKFASGQQTMDHSKYQDQDQYIVTNIKSNQSVNKNTGRFKDEGIVKNSINWYPNEDKTQKTQIKECNYYLYKSK